MAYCLPEEAKNKFMQALADGTFKPDAIPENYDEREAYLKKITGLDDDEVHKFNAEVESKLILKGREAGIRRMVESIANPSHRADLLERVAKVYGVLDEKMPENAEAREAYIERLKNVRNPATEDEFFKDYTSRKLGVRVTKEESETLGKLSKEAIEARDAAIGKTNGSPERERLGAARQAFDKYYAGLKYEKESLLKDFKNIPNDPVKAVSAIGNYAKSFKAVGDISSFFHQSIQVLFTHPQIWAENTVKTFAAMGKEMGEGNAMDGIQAKIKGRELYDSSKVAGVKTEGQEELIPSSGPSTIPIFGKIFNVTQVGFNGFLYQTRMELYETLIRQAQEAAKAQGKDFDVMDKETVRPIGRLVNSMTGRGDFDAFGSGANGVADLLNSVFFSPRLIKANIDTLTAHMLEKGVTPFVRRQAAMNLVKTAVGIASVLTVVDAVQPGSVVWDARSTDFGKVKLDGIAFDLTGGMNSIVVLGMRLLENSTMNSKGEIVPLNSGTYGSTTGMDLVYNFLTNKSSPAASMAEDAINRTDYYGNAITPQAVAEDGFVPFPVQNVIQGSQVVGTGNALLAEIADAFGLYETLPAPPKN